jgi:uncharacterized protein YqeY
MRSVEAWKQALRQALTAAMRAREPAKVAVLRETLAAIDNAEAAETSAAPAVQAGVIAGGVAGLGAGEVARKTLSPEEVDRVVQRELNERHEGAQTLEGLGKSAEAAALRAQAEVLETLRRG